ncbi:hypothetical protein V3391_06780 [Luteimonas sp. SMYT11W]|uniref:NfeD-like C-terminal domain-containing protein n=1 Tax=Luteimonas flava TaxID=3115822 RepID=A0ABU7WD71_9GAMM
MTRKPENTGASSAVLGWNWATLVTILIAYGCALGAIFMRGYWGAFDIDPFQYGGAAETAWAGFAAVAVSMALVAFGAWIGHLIAHRIGDWPTRGRPARASVMAIGGGVLVACWVAGQWWVLSALGGVLVVGFMVTATAALPSTYRTPDAAIWVGVLLVYLPMSAHLTSQSRAQAMSDVTAGRIIDPGRSTIGVELRGPAKLIGRLGGDAVILEANSNSVIFVPQTAELRIVTKPAVDPARIMSNRRIIQEREVEHR